MRNKVVVLIGRHSPFAWICIQEFIAEGANVLFGCPEDKEIVKETLRDAEEPQAGSVEQFPCDLRDEHCDAVIDRAIETYGRIDVIVSWIPNVPSESLVEAEDPVWFEMWEQVAGIVRIYKKAIPHMKKARWGRFIHIGSAQVKDMQPMPTEWEHIIAPGMLGLQKNLAGEGGEYGIMVNSILVDNIQDLVSPYSGTAFPPPERRRDLQDVAALTAFLSSERASYITGVTIVADGGKASTLF